MVLVDDKGNLRIHAPSTYKILAFGDVPAAFKISPFKAAEARRT